MRRAPVFCRSLLAGDFTGRFYISSPDQVLNPVLNRPQAGSYLRTNVSLIGLFASRRQIGNLSLQE